MENQKPKMNQEPADMTNVTPSGQKSQQGQYHKAQEVSTRTNEPVSKSKSASPEPKGFGDARRLTKQKQKERAAQLAGKKPQINMDSKRLKMLYKRFGKLAVDKSLREIARVREEFLDSDPAIRAASHVENGLVWFDHDDLTPEQVQAVKDYTLRVGGSFQIGAFN